MREREREKERGRKRERCLSLPLSLSRKNSPLIKNCETHLSRGRKSIRVAKKYFKFFKFFKTLHYFMLQQHKYNSRYFSFVKQNPCSKPWSWWCLIKSTLTLYFFSTPQHHPPPHHTHHVTQPCTMPCITHAPTHARPSLPVNQKPILTPLAQYRTALHDTSALLLHFLCECRQPPWSS